MDPNQQQQQQQPTPPVYVVAPPPSYYQGFYQPQPQPQPQVVYVQTTYDVKVPLIAPTPTGLVYSAGLNVKDRLLQRDYEVTIGRWFDESWTLFSQNWGICVAFTLVYLLVYCIPYVGPVVGLGLAPGFFIAGMHGIRPNGGGFRGSPLFHGYLWYFPVLWIGILYMLAVMFGFILLIIPGFYFMIALSFSSMVYIEFRSEGLGIIDSMTVSRKVVGKHFCSILLFLILTYLMNVLGCLVFFVGLLVSIPVSSFMFVFAFRDMFGFSTHRKLDNSCFCCC